MTVKDAPEVVDGEVQDGGEDVQEEEAEGVEQVPTFAVHFLKAIKDAQMQHGLRHGDYQRYRGYCTRRIRRVRKALHFVQGDRKHFRKKEVTEEVLVDERYFLIPLMSAERAWSYAMQLKQEANSEPRKKFHMASRLKKAASHAAKLENLCESGKCHAVTKLEAQAYHAWLRGVLNFELQRWPEALESFSKSQTIYEKLAKAVQSEDAVAIYEAKVGELKPSLRFCAYNIGDATAAADLMKLRQQGLGGDLMADIDNLIAQTREKQAATLSEVSWRGRTVPVKFEKVRLFLTNVKEAEKTLAESGADQQLETYEKLLLECKDALQILREELKNDPSFTRRGAGDSGAQVSPLHYLHSYLTWIRAEKTIERNLLLVTNLASGKTVGGGATKAPKPQDYIRLYEGILASLLEISNLPGLEADYDLKESCEAQSLVYKSLRCYHIAESFQQVKRWPECLAMFDRSAEYASKAKAATKASSVRLPKAVSARLDQVVSKIEAGKVAAQASCMSLDVDALADDFKAMAVKSKEKRILAENLDVYLEEGDYLASGEGKLVKFPPEFQPVPCKPLFFDLAWNHVDFPSLDHKLEVTPAKAKKAQQQQQAAAQQTQQQQTGGLSGFVKGLWSWGSNK